MGQHNVPSDESERPHSGSGTLQVRQVLRKPVVWILGLVVAAVASTLTAVVSGVLGHWIDASKLSDALAGDEPVQIIKVQESSYEWGWATTHAISPAEAAMVKLPSSRDEALALDDWMINHGGAFRREEQVIITLEGRRDVPVHINTLRPHVQECQPALSGSLFYQHPPLGPNEDPVLDADFDDPQPIFREGPYLGNSHEPKKPEYFGSHSITLARNEVITLHIVARATMRTCTWDIEAEMIVDGQPVTQILGRNHPWTVTGSVEVGAYEALFVDGKDGFQAVDASSFCSQKGICGDQKP